MRNKKGFLMWDNLSESILVMVVIVIIIGAIIYGIFVNEQIPFIGRQVEHVTEDCDGDEAISLSDDCPCNEDIQNLPGDQDKCPAEIKSGSAKENCPKLC